MKVLMVIERYFPIWGGAENQLQQLIQHLCDLGCEIEILTRRWQKGIAAKELVNDIAVYRVGWPGKGRLATIVFILSLVWFLLRRGRKVDIIHSHGAAALGALGSLAARITRTHNIAKISTAGRIPKLIVNLPGRLILKLFKHSDAIVCISDEIQRELTAIDTSPRRIVRISNGVDGERFRPLPKVQRREWRIAKGLSPVIPVVVFSGRFVHRKGLDVLLDAWHRVIKLHPAAHLIVIGSGANQSDSVEHQIRCKVKEEGIANVSFEGETNSPESYLGISDIYVFPSRKEGLPNALLEAMASGLPIVASEIGGVVNLVEDDETGLLFPCGDVDALSNRIVELLNNPQKLKKIGSQARQHVLEHYSFKQIAQQYLKVYRDVRRTALLSTVSEGKV